jgi:hypothetical protein
MGSWREWQERCALSRCTPAAAERLRLFGWQQFRWHARTGRGGTEAGRLPSAAECWHLLETWMVVGRNRQGKCYKRWLFDRAAGSSDPLDAIRGGASVLMREVVREFLRCEGPHARQVSFDRPPDGSDGRLSAAELLPAPPSADAEEPGMLSMSRTFARRFFERLESRERLVVLAKRLGVPLHHPVVEQRVGVRRSRISLLWRGVFVRLAAEIERALPCEDRSSRLHLALSAASELDQLVFEWARAEDGAAALFALAGNRAAPREG